MQAHEALQAIVRLVFYGLFVLTLAVTPANIYMYTHGAVMQDKALDLSFHYFRFVAQVLLLSILGALASSTVSKNTQFNIEGDGIDAM